jgi:hypothetical protein
MGNVIYGMQHLLTLIFLLYQCKCICICELYFEMLITSILILY